MKSIIAQLEELKKGCPGGTCAYCLGVDHAIAIVNAGTLSDDEIKMTELSLNISHSMNHDKPPEDCKVCYGIINKMKLMRDEIIGGKEGLHEHE